VCVSFAIIFLLQQIIVRVGRMPFITLAARNLKMIKVLNREKFVALVKKKTHKESLTTVERRLLARQAQKAGR
jgi:hypothetical protein